MPEHLEPRERRPDGTPDFWEARASMPFTIYLTLSAEHVADRSFSDVERVRNLSVRAALLPHLAHELITLLRCRLRIPPMSASDSD